MKWEILFPRISLSSFFTLLGLTLAGGLTAGIYGILHDQITYTLSPEYFTRFKFGQFYDVDPGLGNRAFAGVIGFLATGWIGAILGWFYGRLSMCGGKPNVRETMRALILTLAITGAFGFGGFLYATFTFDKKRESWSEWQEAYRIEDIASFYRVGIVHNMGYIGGFAGGIPSVILLRRRCRKPKV